MMDTDDAIADSEEIIEDSCVKNLIKMLLILRFVEIYASNYN